MFETPLHATPTHRVDTLELRFLGVERRADGTEVYTVARRTSPDSAWEQGQLQHREAGAWVWVEAAQRANEPVRLGLPDEVFARAAGTPTPTTTEALPHWPAALRTRLATRRTTGACTVAFDGAWFLEQLGGSPIEHPLLLLDASRKLGLSGLSCASERLDAMATSTLLSLLRSALVAGEAVGWSGEGRLIGESTWGDLAQVGEDIASGCAAAEGHGVLDVVFDPNIPMGLAFGPEVPSADVAAGREPAGDDSVGTGAEVGEVESGGEAERNGIRPGMVVTQVGADARALKLTGRGVPFEEVLDAVDEVRDGGKVLSMSFDTAAPFTHWYAVEMPAASMLAALGSPPVAAADAGVGASFDALCGESLLWREPIPRVFIGDAGSVTCAHVDICPQIQLAHGLLGTKVLGVATHAATPRLRAEHGGSTDDDGDIDEGATHVPTDRPLTPRQRRLLTDSELTLVLLRAGDLAVLHSGALHFASNGADGLGGALYHGIITSPVVPRLRLDAARPGGSARRNEADYGGHLYASDLLRAVELRLDQKATD